MIRVEWHRQWSPAVAEAFEALPYDELMDHEVVQRLYHQGVGRSRQQIAVLRTRDEQPVGVVPLRWRQSWHGLYAWELITSYVVPYARFFVLPEYIDSALGTLNRYINCGSVVFYRLPSRLEAIRPETSWVLRLSADYGEVMRRIGYAGEDRRCRKRSAHLTLYENRYSDIPLALTHWAAKWRARGQYHTANRRDELLVVCETLAAQGRLSTFSLYDGSNFASMLISLVGTTTFYPLVTISLDAYRQALPGIRGFLASMEWACAHGLQEYDLGRTSGNYKQRWGQATTCGYQLIQGPWGIAAAGGAIEAVGGLVNRMYWKFGWRH